MAKRIKQMKMKNIPERIYLQIGAETPKDCNFEELDEVTWCQDRISEDDIEYIRKEKVIKAFKETCALISHHKADECNMTCHILRNFIRGLN